MDIERPYYTPMDQEYHNEVQTNTRRTPGVEEQPILPISLIGQTVPEVDPTGRIRNIVEGVDAAFRGGAGNIQLVMQVPGQLQPIGGGPKAYGQEVREAIREIQAASKGRITGVELPTSINNLSGYTQQGFSEDQRKAALDEVKDAIKFIGDIAGGGGVDIVSFEFPRNFYDAKWYKEEKGLFKQREEEKHLIVDTETGAIQTFHPNQTFYLHRDPGNNQEDTKTVHEWSWSDFKKWSEKENRKPEELWRDYYFEYAQKQDLESQRSMMLMHKIEAQEGLENAKKILDDPNSPEEAKRRYANYKEIYEQRLKSAELSERAVEERKRRIEKIKTQYVTIDQAGMRRAVDSYADAGISAWQESEKNRFVQKGKGSVYVGPEMGWPQFYGSHPQEWVGTILDARERMVKKLTERELDDPATGQRVVNPYYQGVSKDKAEQLAKNHIKGELDTSHLGMWFQSFKQDLPFDERLKQFKGWYKNQIDYLAEQNKKYDLIGGVQVVDSASGAHGHLPPGQGILGKDIFEYMKTLKEKGGYKGNFTSEGHEEEKFGQGRILTKAWEGTGSPIASGYFYGRPLPTFTDARLSYAKIAYGTTGIFQSYVPSNDFTLWSQVPLE